MDVHAEDCGCHGDYFCLRHKLAYWRDQGGMQIDPRATPSRRNTNPPRPPSNSWEKGIATDSRNMPILNQDGSPMGVKQYAANRHAIDEQRRQLHTPDP